MSKKKLIKWQGTFFIYQEENGSICLSLGQSSTMLLYSQTIELGLPIFDLFDWGDYNRFYKVKDYYKPKQKPIRKGE